MAPHRSVIVALVALTMLAACANSAPHLDAAAAPTATTAVPALTATSPPATATTTTSPADARSAADAESSTDGGTAPADAGTAAEPPPAAVIADNQVKPTQGDELQARARGLFEAVVKDEPALADPFWFPKEPFLPLKDVKGPDRYWETLHRTYGRDVHALHATRTSWDGAAFVRYEMGSSPKWVKPGEEANKIGYYRSFRGKVFYSARGREESFDVQTVITWQGRWYVTHLRKVKK